MPRTAQLPYRGYGRGFGRGFGYRWRGWAENFRGLGRRLCEGLGIALVLASLLLLLALLTYSPADASLDTASDSPVGNYLGRDGALIADALLQSLGLAAYLLPAVLLGWAFRLMLQRPVRRPLRCGALLGLALALGAAACSILHPGLALPAGAGGAVGWALLDLAGRAGLAAFALPLAMTAAALVALLLLSVIGLSPGDWRDLGRGAGRAALASGHGTAAVAAVGRRLFRRWHQTRQARQAAEAGPRTGPPHGPRGPSVRGLAPVAAGRDPPPGPAVVRPLVTPLAERREPYIGRSSPPAGAAAPPPADDGTGEGTTGRLVRLVMPRLKPPPPGKRSEQELQPALDLAPDQEPLLPPLSLLTKPPSVTTAAVDEEALAKNARMLEAVLEDYGVRGQIVKVRPGPVVTLYELEPAPGIKASRVIGLADDIARSMSAISVARRGGAGAQRDRHRAAQPQGRDGLSARAAGLAGLRKARRPRSRWRSARISAARR